MYQISNNVYKVLDNGIAVTDVKNKNKLVIVNETNFLSFRDDKDIEIIERNNESLLKDGAYNCGSSRNDNRDVDRHSI